MIFLNKNQQRLPIGGHHFPEAGMIVRGDSFDAVVKKVYDLRITNGHPLGSPKQDVLRYYAEAFPYMVEFDETVDKTVENRMMIRWRHWVQAAWKNPPKKGVTNKEAQLRWEVCKTCPMNLEFTWSPTKETDEIERRAFMLRYGQDVPDYLGYCALHRADLSVFVFVDDPASFSAKENAEDKQEGCWVDNLAGR